MTLLDRVRRAVDRRAALRASGETTAVRLVHGAADGIPEVAVDAFADVLVVGLYGAVDEEPLLDALEAAERPRAIYVKRRPREARCVRADEKARLAPSAPARGRPVDAVDVREAGLAFRIRPGDGLAVGLYLDMRRARAWVRARVRGGTVLNCFAYTCAFSVAAGAGGATRTLNVDLSRRVLRWGEENHALNGTRPAPRDFVAGDAFEWLDRLARKAERFDWVILDPPSFGGGTDRVFSAARDYPRLVTAAARVLSPGGHLVACCNLASLSPERFAGLLERGLAPSGRHAARVAELRPPEDFPVSAGETAGLKVSVLRV